MTRDRSAFDPYAPPVRPVPLSPTATTPRTDTPVTSESDDRKSVVPDDLDNITRADLITLAERYGVAGYGTKADIAARIRTVADVHRTTSGR